MNLSNAKLTPASGGTTSTSPRDWCAEQLAQLGLADTEDFLFDCVFTLSNEDDVRACLASILPGRSSALIEAFVERWHLYRVSAAKEPEPTTSAAHATVDSVTASASVPIDAKRLCECGGLEHPPWNNCLCCGRISCIWERSLVEHIGVCPFCQTAFQADRAQIAQRAEWLGAMTLETKKQQSASGN
jgi:hypothetical protein